MYTHKFIKHNQKFAFHQKYIPNNVKHKFKLNQLLLKLKNILNPDVRWYAQNNLLEVQDLIMDIVMDIAMDMDTIMTMVMEVVMKVVILVGPIMVHHQENAVEVHHVVVDATNKKSRNDF